MRTKQNWVATLLVSGVVMMGVIAFTGCKKDEPTPEIVENPLDKVVYYISGKVMEGTKNLEGVKVSSSGADVTTSADGSFQLPVTKKGTLIVTFSKSGYVTVSAEAVISSDMKKSSSVSLEQQMTTLATPVKVRPDADTTVFDIRTKVAVLSILAGSVDKETEVTVTEYINGARGEINYAGLSTINCLPDGQKFGKPVEVSVKNATSPAIYFSDVRHYLETNGKWQEKGALKYDKTRNVYLTSINGFSNHSFGFKCTVKNGGVVLEDAGAVVIDNLGEMKSTEGVVIGKQKIGWTIEGDLKQLVGARFTSLSSTDVEALAGQLEKAVISTKGIAAGISEIPLSLGTAKVSGDMKVTVDLKVRKVTYTLVFNLNYQGKDVEFNIPVVTYSGINTTITTQYGASHTDHSGSVID